ncbi:hypothetical protein LUTEI9C_50083 [Luteimonas sp. 9C]|nr:hypothetical protein LUTEI9C_50083 [Luteimonas sp. 9C]
MPQRPDRQRKTSGKFSLNCIFRAYLRRKIGLENTGTHAIATSGCPASRLPLRPAQPDATCEMPCLPVLALPFDAAAPPPACPDS